VTNNEANNKLLSSMEGMHGMLCCGGLLLPSKRAALLQKQPILLACCRLMLQRLFTFTFSHLTLQFCGQCGSITIVNVRAVQSVCVCIQPPLPPPPPPPPQRPRLGAGAKGVWGTAALAALCFFSRFQIPQHLALHFGALLRAASTCRRHPPEGGGLGLYIGLGFGGLCPTLRADPLAI